MTRISNRHVDVLILLNITDLPNGNALGDAYVVNEDGSFAPANNIDAGETYSVLHLTEAGWATPSLVVSAQLEDVHGTGSSVQRLRVEVKPLDAPKVQVVP